MYKVPFRRVYTGTLKDWVTETIWCHFVIKVFPKAVNLGSDPLKDYYKEKPEKFYDQYRHHFESLKTSRN